MEYNHFYRKKSICTNCGKNGHEYKMCHEPITSYGIVNIDILDNYNENLILKDKFSTTNDFYYKIVSKKYPDVKCFISDNIRLSIDQSGIYKLDNETIPCENEEQIHKFFYYKNKILFMMVSRKFSLGFIEFIRGKYDVSDSKGIINLFKQMYEEEIKLIRKSQYDTLLYYFSNRNNESIDIVLNKIYEGKYSAEYCEAKIKFNMLRNLPDDENSDIPLDLNFYTKYIKPKWKKPEWGFPKGRREGKVEENLTCACREFEEETGYTRNEYLILDKINPIEEKLTGTNGVQYKHIYYLAINNTEKNVSDLGYDACEIGGVKWFTYDDAMAQIRPYHIEKKKILTRVYLFVLNYLISNDYIYDD